MCGYQFEPQPLSLDEVLGLLLLASRRTSLLLLSERSHFHNRLPDLVDVLLAAVLLSWATSGYVMTSYYLHRRFLRNRLRAAFEGAKDSGQENEAATTTRKDCCSADDILNIARRTKWPDNDNEPMMRN